MTARTKDQTKLGKDIGKNHYVKLSTDAQKKAARVLAANQLVRVYEKDGGFWAKALSRDALDEMRSWR